MLKLLIKGVAELPSAFNLKDDVPFSRSLLQGFVVCVGDPNGQK